MKTLLATLLMSTSLPLAAEWHKGIDETHQYYIEQDEATQVVSEYLRTHTLPFFKPSENVQCLFKGFLNQYYENKDLYTQFGIVEMQGEESNKILVYSLDKKKSNASPLDVLAVYMTDAESDNAHPALVNPEVLNSVANFVIKNYPDSTFKKYAMNGAVANLKTLSRAEPTWTVQMTLSLPSGESTDIILVLLNSPLSGEVEFAVFLP